MSTGTNIERITQNNTIIDDNNDDLIAFKNRINNLPDTSTATAQSKDIVQGKTAFVNGNQVTGTCDWQNIEWRPQVDWWDIKTIVANDTEDYPMKIIVLFDEANKTTYWDWTIASYGIQNLKKIKFSDGQEITSAQTITIGDNGFKPCSKGYKTGYAIYCFSGIPILTASFGDFFKNSLYVYFYNITDIDCNSMNWTTNNNEKIECYDSNTRFSTSNRNSYFNNVGKAFALHKIPNFFWKRGQGTHYPNVVSLSNAPNLKYANILGIIQNRNFNWASGQMPLLDGVFYNETIDFENDWGLDTTLFTRLNNINGAYAIQKLDCTNVVTAGGTISVVEIYNISNIKITNEWFNNRTVSYNTLIRVLNALYDYSESTDTHTLTLGSFNLSRLTAEEKAIATNKGWTLA